MNKPKLWKDYKLVDNGNLTKNLHTLHYFHNQLISEYDDGNVENILIENNQLQQKVNQLEEDKTHLIEIISGLINYVKDTYNEDLTDKTAEVMEMFLDKVGGSNG